MKIYFTCSTADFNTHKETYFGIRDFLVDQKHILTRDWLANANYRISNKDLNFDDTKTIYKECMRAISEADLVIIEDTVSSFSTGHQITVALQRQKPTLVLWQGRKHRHFKKMFIHGIDSEYLETAEYEKGEYKKIITKFINKYENVNHKNRFHLVLSNVERKYLDWAQFNKGKSRTNMIRKSIQKELEQDEEYQSYLAGESKV